MILLLALGVLRWHAELISSLYANLGDIELANMVLRPEGERSVVFAHLRSALAWDNTNGRAYANLGQAYAAVGRYDEAIAAGKEGVVRGVQDPLAFYRLGEAYMRAGDMKQGKDLWRRAFGRSPSGSVSMANRLIAGGFIEDGVEELKLAAALPGINDSLRVSLYRRIAETDALNWRKPAETQFYAELALSMGPGDGILHRWLAWALYIQGESQRAVAEASQAISLGDTAATTYEVLGRAALASGDVDQAISALEVSVSKNSWVLWAQQELGQAYQQKGMRQEAIARFKIVLQIYPGFPQAQKALEQLGCKLDC